MSARTRELEKRIEGLVDPESIMIEIMDVFQETEIIPDVGKYYTFIYIPKTQDIAFDQHPLVAVTEIYQWGFKGLNFHWREVRNYTWLEIAGFLHVIKNNEIDYMRGIKYARYLVS